MAFDPNRPFNDLPDLPPASETETRAILRSCIAARAALAELRVSGGLVPNQAMLTTSIPLLEAQASSEIQTARLNGIEPYAWLKATLEAIAAGHPNNRIDDLMPWAFNPAST